MLAADKAKQVIYIKRDSGEIWIWWDENDKDYIYTWKSSDGVVRVKWLSSLVYGASEGIEATTVDENVYEYEEVAAKSFGAKGVECVGVVDIQDGLNIWSSGSNKIYVSAGSYFGSVVECVHRKGNYVYACTFRDGKDDFSWYVLSVKARLHKSGIIYYPDE